MTLHSSRKSKASLVAVVAAVVAAATALAACGGGDAGSSAASSSAAPVPSADPNAIKPSLVGMHIEGAEGGAWASAPFGALRIWDNGTGWSQIELEPGVFKWDNLDGVVENATSKGMTDILMVLGTTPEWNAKEVGKDDYPQPGAASAPKDRQYSTTPRKSVFLNMLVCSGFGCYNNTRIRQCITANGQ
ncbi:MAG: hypothetical protein ACKOW5_12025 [Actinomycetales bacterium]